jgi:hypothetical protein
MKRTEVKNEKLMHDVARENKRLTEPLSKVGCPPAARHPAVPSSAQWRGSAPQLHWQCNGVAAPLSCTGSAMAWQRPSAALAVQWRQRPSAALAVQWRQRPSAALARLVRPCLLPARQSL